MATQADNVLDPDEISRLRASVRSGASNLAEQISEKVEDAVTFVTSPVEPIFYDPTAKAYALGLFSGVIISLLVKHFG